VIRNALLFVIINLFVCSAFAEEIIEFPDPNLEAFIRENINTSTGSIFDTDLLGITYLNASNRGITDLSGIEYCINLKTLNLSTNSITDIHNLKGLSNLSKLYLRNNLITDVSALTELQKLTNLQLRGNIIDDLSPLTFLTQLSWLDLRWCHASDISFLAGLTNLKSAYLGGNKISDISPLTNLRQLVTLELCKNHITDISPLRCLTSLELLNLDRNFISNIDSIEELTEVKFLGLSENCIKDILPLSQLVNIQNLGLSKNLITSVAPLVQNSGISSGDSVDVRQNLLYQETYNNDIPILVEKLGLDNLAYDEPNGHDPVVLDFQVFWGYEEPYTKYFPYKDNGEKHGWACGYNAYAQILRYLSQNHSLPGCGHTWHRSRLTHELFEASYDTPFSWNSMLPSIAGFDNDDPRIEPIADFAYRFTMAMRDDWGEHSAGWQAAARIKKGLGSFLGIDVMDFKRTSISSLLTENTMDEIYAKINSEIDAGRPCEMILASTSGGCHEVVVTGYRQVGDNFEYSIHFGGLDYDRSSFYRLDRPIGNYDACDSFCLSWGIKPLEESETIFCYNKVAEIYNDLSVDNNPVIATDPNGYAIIMPVDDTHAHFMRGSLDGTLLDGSPTILTSESIPSNLAIVRGTKGWAVAWSEDISGYTQVQIELIDPNGTLLLEKPLIFGMSDFPSLAWNGQVYGLAFKQNSSIHFSCFTEDGSIVDGTELDFGEGCDPSIISADNNFYVVWASQSSIKFASIDTTENLIPQIKTIDFRDALSIEKPKITWSGQDFGLAWVHNGSIDGLQISFSLMSRDGILLTTYPLIVSDTGISNVRQININAINGKFYLSYNVCCPWDAYLAIISEEAELLKTRWLFNYARSLEQTAAESRLILSSTRYYEYPKDVNEIVPYEVTDIETCVVPIVP